MASGMMINAMLDITSFVKIKAGMDRVNKHKYDKEYYMKINIDIENV